MNHGSWKRDCEAFLARLWLWLNFIGKIDLFWKLKMDILESWMTFCLLIFTGVDFPLKKHSHQRAGLIDTVLRVRCTSIVKMISAGIRQERRKVFSFMICPFHWNWKSESNHITRILSLYPSVFYVAEFPGKFSKENEFRWHFKSGGAHWWWACCAPVF